VALKVQETEIVVIAEIERLRESYVSHFDPNTNATQKANAELI
jgi:hypothetical protein